MEGIEGKKEIIKQLKERILRMEGFSREGEGKQLDFGLGEMVYSFPGNVFPLGAIHEFVSLTESNAAAANGFISWLLSTFIKRKGICIWISATKKIFPPAMKFFGIEPHQIIFIDVKRSQEILWVMEQALKSSAVAIVVAELREVSFAESRRLQLAVESSRVTGFLHRQQLYSENTLACVSRWKIRPLPSQHSDGLPGVGFPRIEVELEKIRNGRPGIWQLTWQNESFQLESVRRAKPLTSNLKKKQNYA